MTAQTDLLELIRIMRKGTPQELGKAWRERAKLYKKSPVKEFDNFVHSNKSLIDELNGKLVPDLDQ
jgi:hypothetical protein